MVLQLTRSLLPAAVRSQPRGGSLHWEHLLERCSWFADTMANTDPLEETNCGAKCWGAPLCSGRGSWSRIRLAEDTETEFRGSSLSCWSELEGRGLPAILAVSVFYLVMSRAATEVQPYDN